MESIVEPHFSKLQAIYDAIENRSFKQGIKLISQQLQKYPHSKLLPALKAIALERSGQKEEALQICDQLCGFATTPDGSIVQKNVILDENVISNVARVLKEAQQWKKCELLYENAWKAMPKNEDFGVWVFYSHARQLNFLKQQQTAMKLYRDFKKDKYLFWAISSMVMQAKEKKDVPAGSASAAGGMMDKAKLLDLATKMMEKAISEGKCKNSELARFYVDLLEKQSRFQDAIAFVSGPTGKLLDPLPYDRKTILANLFKKAEQHQNANAIFAHLVANHDSDEWSWWLGFIDAVIALQEQAAGNSNSNSNSSSEQKKDVEIVIGDEKLACTCTLSVDGSLRFIHEIQQKEKPGHERRGPFLIEIELYHRLKRSDDVYRSLIGYFKKFGSKPSCYGDMNIYLSTLKPENYKQFFQDLKAAIPAAASDDKHAQVSAVRYNVTRARLFVRLGQHKEQPEAFYEEMAAAYHPALALGKDLAVTERQHGDQFLLLCAHVLIQQHFHHHRHNSNITDWGYIIDAIKILEYGLSKSIHNFQFKLLLIRLYALMGCVRPAIKIFNTLSIKHIQWDTMSYLVLHDALRSGLFDQASAIVGQVVNFHYGEHFRESPDLTLFGYNNESYSKIEEFVAFRERLDSSLQRAIAETENLLLQLSSHASLPSDSYAFLERTLKDQSDCPPVRYDSIICNDDTTVTENYSVVDDISSIDPACAKFISGEVIVPRECSTPLAQRVNTLKLRRLVPRLLLAAVRVVAQKKKAEEQEQQRKLQKKQESKKASASGKGKPAATAATPEPQAQQQTESDDKKLEAEFAQLMDEFNQVLAAENESLTKENEYNKHLWMVTQSAFTLSLETVRFANMKAAAAEENDSSHQESLAKLEKQINELTSDIKACMDAIMNVFTEHNLNPKSADYHPSILEPLSKLLGDHMTWLLVQLPVWTALLPSSRKTRAGKAGKQQQQQQPVDSGSQQVDLRIPLTVLKNCLTESFVNVIQASIFAQYPHDHTHNYAERLHKTKVPQVFLGISAEDLDKVQKKVYKRINKSIAFSFSRMQGRLNALSSELKTTHI